MIKVENIVAPSPEQWKAVIRGMRNPLNSWSRSDSFRDKYAGNAEEYVLGTNDLNLMRKLFAAGTEHRKYLRMLPLYIEVTAPLYWWKEFDTYKVGTVANSCSTMHKIASQEFSMNDFSVENMNEWNRIVFKRVIDAMNCYREKYNRTKDKDDWWQLIQLLPSSYNQRRTVMMNYEVACTMLRQRTGHKLNEWNDFCDVILEDVPYLKEIIGG